MAFPNAEELAHALEPVIRRVVREELSKLVEKYGMFNLHPDMPLYDDLQDILTRREHGELVLHDHHEVWDE